MDEDLCDEDAPIAPATPEEQRVAERIEENQSPRRHGRKSFGRHGCHLRWALQSAAADEGRSRSEPRKVRAIYSAGVLKAKKNLRRTSIKRSKAGSLTSHRTTFLSKVCLKVLPSKTFQNVLVTPG